jgi:two-component system, NarL family, nitrate/nitrite response regulator NarL
MRIVVADAHRVFAEVLTSLLKKAGHEIVGCARYMEDAASIIMAEQVDACVLDLGLPSIGQATSIAQAVARAPRTAFVVLAESADSESLASAVAAGVRGVALKSDDLVEILRVLAGATSGRVVSRAHGNAVLSMSVQTGLGIRGRRRHSLEPGQFLTQREREALYLLVGGESTTSIARSMGVQLSTARSHVDAVLTKLGVHTRLEAVAFAVREGLVDVDRLSDAADREDYGQRAVSG